MLRIHLLLREDEFALSGVAGVEQKYTSLEVLDCIGGDLDRGHCNVACAVDFVAVEATPNGNVLILLSDRMARDLNFYMARLLRQLPLWDMVSLQRMESHKQCHQVTSRTAHSRPSGDISHGGYLDIAGYLKF